MSVDTPATKVVGFLFHYLIKETPFNLKARKKRYNFVKTTFCEITRLVAPYAYEWLFFTTRMETQLLSIVLDTNKLNKQNKKVYKGWARKPTVLTVWMKANTYIYSWAKKYL